MKKRNYLRCVSLSTESICPKRKTAIITAMVITENMAAMDIMEDMEDMEVTVPMDMDHMVITATVITEIKTILLSSAKCA